MQDLFWIIHNTLSVRNKKQQLLTTTLEQICVLDPVK